MRNKDNGCIPAPVTGSNASLTVEEKLQIYHAADLELVGEGGNSRVYRLDDDRVVKAFHEDIPFDMVAHENTRSREAYAAGVPCAASFGMARVDSCYGIVYERLDSADLLTMIARDKTHIPDYIRNFADAVRIMHSRKVDTTRMSDAKTVFLGYLKRLEGRLCTADEVRRLAQVCETIPDRTTFIHGDCHPGNVLMRDGRMLLVDLSSCGYGHPIFDLVGMCSIYLLSSRDEKRRQSLVPTRDFTGEECRMIWETFLRAYLQTDDETYLNKVQDQIVGFARVRHLLRTIIVPDEALHMYGETKRVALEYVDGKLETVFF